MPGRKYWASQLKEEVSHRATERARCQLYRIGNPFWRDAERAVGGARYEEKFNGWNPIAVEFGFDRSKRSAALALEANADRFNLPFFVFSYGSPLLCGSSIADKLLPLQSGKKPKRTEADGIWPLISLSCALFFFILLEHEPSLSMLECSATKHRDASATNRQISDSPGSLSLVLFFWVFFSDIQINIPLGYLRPPAGSMIFAVDGGRDKE